MMMVETQVSRAGVGGKMEGLERYLGSNLVR